MTTRYRSCSEPGPPYSTSLLACAMLLADRSLTRGHARQQVFSHAHTRSCSHTEASLIIGVAGLRPAGLGRGGLGLKAPQLPTQANSHNHTPICPHAHYPACLPPGVCKSLGLASGRVRCTSHGLAISHLGRGAVALLDRLKPEDQRIYARVGFTVGPPRSGDARPKLVAAPRLAPRADTLLQVGHDAVRDAGISVRAAALAAALTPGLRLVCLVMFSFPSLLAGSGPRHDPCPSARPGEPGEGCGRGWPGCAQAGRAATCAAERPCRPVGRVPWGEGAALPRRPAQRGMLANGRRRSARAIVTQSAETGPGLREGLQPRVERGRPWPARPTRRTRIALGRSTAIARTLMCLYSPRRCSCAPSVPQVQGMTEGKPSGPITQAYRTRRAPDTRGAFARFPGHKVPWPPGPSAVCRPFRGALTAVDRSAGGACWDEAGCTGRLNRARPRRQRVVCFMTNLMLERTETPLAYAGVPYCRMASRRSRAPCAPRASALWYKVRAFSRSGLTPRTPQRASICGS